MTKIILSLIIAFIFTHSVFLPFKNKRHGENKILQYYKIDSLVHAEGVKFLDDSSGTEEKLINGFDNLAQVGVSQKLFIAS